MPPRPFRVLHATDGSLSARAAMLTSAAFPWPSHSEAQAIIARPGLTLPPGVGVWAQSDTYTRRAAVTASRLLRARWQAADVVVRDGEAADCIHEEATRWGAHAVVIGWRGHGRFRRLLMGSVSRAVLRRVATPVLVVRRERPRVRHLVVGVDGSAASDRAVRFLRHGRVPRGGAITLVTVLPVQLSPSHPWLPGLTAELRAEALAQGAKNHAAAERRHERFAHQLQKAGWRVRGQIRTGAPLYELLRSVDETRADALVVGSTSLAAPREGIIGSTTEGAVNRSAVPVLVVP